MGWELFCCQSQLDDGTDTTVERVVTNEAALLVRSRRNGDKTQRREQMKKINYNERNKCVCMCVCAGGGSLISKAALDTKSQR